MKDGFRCGSSLSATGRDRVYMGVATSRLWPTVPSCPKSASRRCLVLTLSAINGRWSNGKAAVQRKVRRLLLKRAERLQGREWIRLKDQRRVAASRDDLAFATEHLKAVR